MLKVLNMYPDILNNYGDIANLRAIERICKKIGTDCEITRIENYGNKPEFESYDIILFNAGEYRTMPRIIKDLKSNLQSLKKAVDLGKFIFVFNLTGSVFGKKTERLSGETYEGLGLLDIEFKEKAKVYGDDIIAYDGMFELIGNQISMGNVTLSGEKFAYLIYGYGNNGKDMTEGARKNNLIFTNLSGPLFVRNPWYCEYIIRKCLGMEVKEGRPFNINDYEDEFPLEVKSYKAVSDFIKNKTRPNKEEMERYVK